MINLDMLASKPIAVLGGGATGRCIAADCSLAGREVRLFEHPEFEKHLGVIKENRQIRVTGKQANLYGFKRDGIGLISRVTTNMHTAVEGAGIIIISIPALGFRSFFDLLIPQLEDDMVIHFMTGNFGSLILREMMRNAGCDKRVIIGEWSSQPYGVRNTTIGSVQLPEVFIFYRAITLRGASLPGTDQNDFIASARVIPAMDSVLNPVHGNTVVDIGLSNVNPILHVPGTLLGVSTMENYGRIFGEDPRRFSIYSHAYCPSISEVQYGLYLEECAIAKAMGVGIQPFNREDFFSRSNILGAEFMGPDFKIPFEQQYELLYTTGPFDIFNRYVTEDIPVGVNIYHQLAQKYKVKVPIIEAMITLGSVMTKIDFRQKGFTLKDLGIDRLSQDQLINYLHNGEYPVQ